MINILRSHKLKKLCSFFVSQSLVTQLVKSRDNIRRLRMKMDPKQSKDFEFDDGKVMQIIQFLKQARFFFFTRPCHPSYVYV